MEQNMFQDATPQEKSAIYSMAESYRSAQNMDKVKKLLIIYYVYTEKTKHFLSNLHSLGASILSKQVKLTGKAIDDPNDEDVKIRTYQINVKEIEAKIKVDFIKINKDQEFPNLKSIRLYDAKVQQQKVRVVTLPIDKNLIDISEANSIREKIQKFQNENYQKRRKLNLKGQPLQRFLQQCEIERKRMQEQQCLKMVQKHQKMFNIEALIHVIRQKTSQISICALVPAKQFNDQPTKYDEEINSLFNIPKQARQVIVHTVTNLNQVDALKQKNNISSIYTFKGSDVTCPKNQCFKDTYYMKNPLTIKTKIYSLMNDARNQFLATIIQRFCKVWSNIASSSCTPIAAVVKRIYQSLDYGEDSGSSSLISVSKIDSSKDLGKDFKLTVFYTFQEIFEKYGFDKDQNLKQSLITKIGIEEFYTPERLGKVILQKNQKLCEGIQQISFIHFFQKINSQFLSSYPEQEKKDHQQLFKFVLQYLKTVYQLVNSINSTFAENDNKTPRIKCKNMQAYFNFIDFLFHSSRLIRSITGRQLSICGSVKSLFDQLKPKQNRLLSFILSRPQKILYDQPVHYYDLYLKIIKEKSKGIENRIDYIYLLIHQHKADKISKDYSYSKERVVQAIKSYSQIIHQYPKLTENKKMDIKRLEIQKKIARLLIVVGLLDEAALIYQKNHLVKSVQKCFKQILMSLQGDSKSKKYIQFAQYFERQFSYFRAIDYYQSAYEVAKSKEMRQQSLKQKIECYNRMNNLKQEHTRVYSRYYNGDTTQDEFLNEKKEDKSEKISIFAMLRNKLKWEKSTGASVINEGNSVEESMIQ